jgi:hypothetical protein
MSSIRFASPLVKDVALWHQRTFDGLRVAAGHRAVVLLVRWEDEDAGPSDQVRTVQIGWGTAAGELHRACNRGPAVVPRSRSKAVRQWCHSGAHSSSGRGILDEGGGMVIVVNHASGIQQVGLDRAHTLCVFISVVDSDSSGQDWMRGLIKS